MRRKVNTKKGARLMAALLAATLGLSACGSKPVTLEMNSEGETSQEKVEEATQEVAEDDTYEDHMDRSAEGLKLIWNDEFDGDSLDTTKWSYQYGTGSQYGLDGWGNSEEQYYTDREENVKVEDGKLIITAIKEESPYEGKPYTSGRIRTVTDEDEVLFATTYGRAEARIRMPKGEGLWPAFWMLPADPSIYDQWASSGEIDIMEARGRLPQVIGGTLHYGKNWPNNVYKGEEYTFPEGTDITDFHVYSVEWEPGVIRWYVDEECYYSTEQWFATGKEGAAEFTYPAPFDVPFYILLNMAVGGTFDPSANLDNAEFPATMEVDFVRVYQKEAGYEPVDTMVVMDTRDTASYTTYAEPYADGDFITDKEFTTMNTESISDTDAGIVPTNKDWQFAVGNFGGAATAAVEEIDGQKFARVDITSPGSQAYSVQLIQHFPIAAGYSYEISFDAKADAKRNFVVSPSGDADNGWAKYNSNDVSVDTELKSYNFVFKMNGASDPTARLEFNLGLATGSVWIGNVCVKVVEEEGGINPDRKKTPLTGGNVVYNGTFDQGAGRLAYWYVEGMDALIPDFVVTEDGKEDYSRMVQLTATSDSAALYQTNIELVPEKEYFLRFDLKGEKDTNVQVQVISMDGSKVFMDETCEYKAADGMKRFEFHYDNTSATEESVMFKITLPNGESIWLDNIKMNKVL